MEENKDPEDITIRDMFAIAAMVGFCSMADAAGDWTWATREAAKTAYEMADAMLKAREMKE